VPSKTEYASAGKIDGVNHARNLNWSQHEPEVVYWRSEHSLIDRYEDIRKRLFIAFLKSWADLFALFLVLPLLVSWRNTYVWAQLKYTADSLPGQCNYSRGVVGKPHTVYRAVVLGWYTILLDLCTFLLLLVAILPVIQIPALLLHCNAISDFWNRHTTRLALLRAAEVNRQKFKASASPESEQKVSYLEGETEKGRARRDEKRAEREREREERRETTSLQVQGTLPALMNDHEYIAAVNHNYVPKRLVPNLPPVASLSLEVKHDELFEVKRELEEKSGPKSADDIRKPREYLSSLFEDTDLVFLLGFMPASDYQEMWQESLRVFQQCDSYAHEHDEQCFFRHQFPQSSSLYLYIFARHALMTFSHAFPAYLRFASKFVGVSLNFILVLYIEISILFANCCYRTPQKFSAKDRTNLFSRLGMIHFAQAILLPGYIAVHIGLIGLPALVECLVIFAVVNDVITRRLSLSCCIAR